MTLSRDCEPLLGATDDFVPKRAGHYDGVQGDLHELCCARPLTQLSAAPACCIIAPSGYQPLAPDLNGYGVHNLCDLPSVAEVRGKVGEQFTSFVEGLLIHDERRDTEEHLLAEDVLRLPWLRTIAKVASRDIQVCCIPVSELAGKYLQHELTKIKSSAPQSAAWHGKTRWWLSDNSTQLSGDDRVQRLVSTLIRSETKTHAFDSTGRKKVPKHQKHHDHSIFRQLAQSFEPPRAEQSVISSNESNHPVAGSSRKVGVTATRDVLQSAGFQMFDESISGAARDKKAAGRREVHGIKDLQHSNPDGSYVPGMVYTFVDQDMYIDTFAKYAGENMVIITPEYNKLAGVGPIPRGTIRLRRMATLSSLSASRPSMARLTPISAHGTTRRTILSSSNTSVRPRLRRTTSASNTSLARTTSGSGWHATRRRRFRSQCAT
jgi:hypothetical protein